MIEFSFTSTLIKWDGAAAWFFILLPQDLSEEIDRISRGMKGGWGSVKVTATIGASSWSTSIFPDRKRGAYLLPVKKEIRRAADIGEGDDVDVALLLTP